MRVKIKYRYDKKNEPHFWAESELNGDTVFSAGDSWEQARSRHIRKLAEATAEYTPPIDEEIEL